MSTDTAKSCNFGQKLRYFKWRVTYRVTFPARRRPPMRYFDRAVTSGAPHAPRTACYCSLPSSLAQRGVFRSVSSSSSLRTWLGRGRRRRPRPSVDFPITRRGRAVCDVSHVWHAPRACHGHRHEWPRHARIPPLIRRVVLGLSVYVLGPRWIMLEGRDRPNARSASAEAVDHRPAILADEA